MGNAIKERYEFASEQEEDQQYFNASFNKAIALYYKGLSLLNLKKYSEAIESLGKAIEYFENLLSKKGLRENLKEAIIKAQNHAYLERGRSSYMLRDYPSALADFRKITHPDLNGEKFNNIGIWYYEQGLYKEAEEQYEKAIESNSKLSAAYYNLGILYSIRNKSNTAREMFENSLKSDPNFPGAREAIRKLKGASQFDWYDWWFGDLRQKDKKQSDKKSFWSGKGKKILGLALIFLASASILLVIAASIISSVKLVQLEEQEQLQQLQEQLRLQLIPVLGMLLIILVVIPILPMLKKIKVAGIEIDAEPAAGPVKLATVVYHIVV